MSWASPLRRRRPRCLHWHRGQLFEGKFTDIDYEGEVAAMDSPGGVPDEERTEVLFVTVSTFATHDYPAAPSRGEGLQQRRKVRRVCRVGIHLRSTWTDPSGSGTTTLSRSTRQKKTRRSDEAQQKSKKKKNIKRSTRHQPPAERRQQKRHQSWTLAWGEAPRIDAPGTSTK